MECSNPVEARYFSVGTEDNSLIELRPGEDPEHFQEYQNSSNKIVIVSILLLIYFKILQFSV